MAPATDRRLPASDCGLCTSAPRLSPPSPSALVAGPEMAGRPEKVRWGDDEGRRSEANRRDSPTARPRCGCPRR